jgi:hypothetical protein
MNSRIVVFGDDWGRHPSTTQHLVRHLRANERVVWINSIGMRTPRLNRADIVRAAEKACKLFNRKCSPEQVDEKAPIIIDPLLLPFHTRRLPVALNRRLLLTAIRRELGQRLPRLSVLTALPAAAPYLSALPVARVAYLRLDDYARLPGVDHTLVQQTEAQMFERADVILATARALVPSPPWDAKTVYLPQGVDTTHFARTPLEPRKAPVLGFFGLLAEWIDYELVRRVAVLLPDWRLELMGPVRHLPEHILRLPNVVHRRACPYAELPEAIAHWAAAWAPFEVSALTATVNPLKVREYLAAGLAAHCTPLPEANPLAEDLLITSDPARIADWARSVLASDDATARARRRASMTGEDWQARAERLRELLSPSHR